MLAWGFDDGGPLVGTRMLEGVPWLELGCCFSVGLMGVRTRSGETALVMVLTYAMRDCGPQSCDRNHVRLL